jgi:hypothetical protein
VVSLFLVTLSVWVLGCGSWDEVGIRDLEECVVRTQAG